MCVAIGGGYRPQDIAGFFIVLGVDMIVDSVPLGRAPGMDNQTLAACILARMVRREKAAVISYRHGDFWLRNPLLWTGIGRTDLQRLALEVSGMAVSDAEFPALRDAMRQIVRSEPCGIYNLDRARPLWEADMRRLNEGWYSRF